MYSYYYFLIHASLNILNYIKAMNKMYNYFNFKLTDIVIILTVRWVVLGEFSGRKNVGHNK